MKLLLYISSLGPGGAERILSALARAWAEAGRDVTVVTTAGTDDDFHDLPDSVDRVGLGLRTPSDTLVDAIRSNVDRVRSLRRVVRDRDSDAVISFGPNPSMTAIAATVGFDVTTVIAERNHPDHLDLSPAWRRIRDLLYPLADAVVVQTPGIAEAMASTVPREKVHVIPNPALIPDDIPGRDLDEPTLFAMGSLNPQKGFDRLIDAFATVADKHPEWTLTILGEGPRRDRLEDRVISHGIADRVELPGLVDDPFEVLAGGGLFVLSSRYEGFPNALVEAMGSGLAVISFDCPGAPSRIVRDGVDGLLVDDGDVDGLAAAMDRLMADPELRREMGRRAVKVKERFPFDDVLEMWDDLLDPADARTSASSRGST